MLSSQLVVACLRVPRRGQVQERALELGLEEAGLPWSLEEELVLVAGHLS